MLTREQVHHVRCLCLANPPSNVLTLKLLESLRHEIAQAQKEEDVRCLMIASDFPRYFSSGLDLKEWLSLPEDRRAEPFEAIMQTFRALLGFTKPTIACVGGSALLGGWIVAMACDFRLFSPTAKISLSEIRLGISPSAPLIRHLSQIASNPLIAKEMVLRGKTIRAEEALAAGLADWIVPEESLKDEGLRHARALSRQALPAYASVKKALWPIVGEKDVWREGREEFERLMATPEAHEGLCAMLEKRRPRWED